MSKTQIDKLPGEDSFAESLERVHQAERERLNRALARELGRPLQEWEIEFLDKYLEKVGEELDRYIVYEYGEKQVAGKLNNPDDSLLTDEESITIQTGQTYGKSAYVASDPDTDLISRQGVIDAIEGTVWYRINKNGEMVSGSTNEHESWYKHDDIMSILKTIPSPPVEPKSATDDCISRQVAIEEIALHDPTNGTEPYFSGHEVIDILKCVPTATHAKRTETHGVCSDCISRQAVFYILENKMIDRPLASDRWVIRDIGKAIESLPTVELKPVCEDAISRQAAIEAMAPFDTNHELRDTLESLPPVEDMGEVSDGYHTFNQLYHQRAVLFATIVNQNKDKAWKSWKHEDGEFCFDKGGEWFIVGVDTPEGSYTYHYEQKYWDTFDCEELDRGKQWDGHTEEDVTRLLSLPPVEPTVTKEWLLDTLEEIAMLREERPRGEWLKVPDRETVYACDQCGCEPYYFGDINTIKFCPNCGSRMCREDGE